MAERDAAERDATEQDSADRDLTRSDLKEPVSRQITRDAFFGGRLVLEQPAKGHRSGTDAILLAASTPRNFRGLVYDMGAGVGAVGLGTALVCPRSEILLVEKDAQSVFLARRNVEANDLRARVEVVRCDLLSKTQRETQLARKADLILTNPPFYRTERVRASHDANRRAAHVMEEGASLEDWLVACLASLSAKGTMIVLHQAEAAPEILHLLSHRLGELTMMAVHPRSDQPAVRVLIRGRGGSRAPFHIAPPLILHEGNAFTPEAVAIHEGQATLGW